jgi:hypothetical protein
MKAGINLLVSLKKINLFSSLFNKTHETLLAKIMNYLISNSKIYRLKSWHFAIFGIVEFDLKWRVSESLFTVWRMYNFRAQYFFENKILIRRKIPSKLVRELWCEVKKFVNFNKFHKKILNELVGIWHFLLIDYLR